MADTTFFEYRTVDGIPVEIKLTDNGDGTYSMAGGSSGPSTPTTPTSGELPGSVGAAVQCPTVAAQYVYLTARTTNQGNFYIGPAGVTVPNGAIDTTSGLELAPGAMITIPIDNLNKLYRISDNAGDVLTYLVVA